MNISLFIYLFILNLISKSNEQQEITKIEINKPIKGELSKNKYAYYSLEIIKEITHPEDYLIIKLELNSNEIFSDPNMYISDTEKYPSPDNFNWSCTKYGNDIITIHNTYIKKGKIFYISVTCDNKCNYTLTININHIITIIPQKISSFKINKGNSMLFNFKTKVNDYEHLSFQFLSQDLSPYIIYISNNDQPSSSNTFKLRPAWINGYIFDVRKNDNKSYCINCEFKILIQAPKYDANIRMLFSYIDNDIIISNHIQIFDSIVDKYVKCYKSPMNQFNDEIDSFVLSITLFTGSLFLREYGFIENKEKKFESLNEDNSHHIITEKLIVIPKEKINKFKEIQKELPYYNDSFFHYCVKVDNECNDASYLIGGYFSSNTETYQKLNMLMIGKSVKGYLPKNQVTKYKILDLSSNSDISLNLDIRVGNPILYAYFNENSLKNNPIINKGYIDNLIKENKILFSTKTFNGASIRILNKDNICHKEKKGIETEVEKLKCAIYAIVYCDNEENIACQYRITAVNRKSSSYIIPKTLYYGSLMKEEKDSYNFGIYDENIESVTIVLNTLTGDTSLNVTVYSFNKKEVIKYSKKSEIFEPLVLTIKDKDLKSDEGIQNNFDIIIISSIYSTYSLYYYTNNKKLKKKDYQIKEIDLIREKSGFIMDNISKQQLFIVYMFEINESHKKNKEDLIISLSKASIEDFNLYLFDKFSEFEYNKNLETKLINVKGFKAKNDYNNMIVIENSNKLFRVGKYYLFAVRKYFPENKKTNIIQYDNIFIRISMKSSQLILFESLIQTEILYTNYDYQRYLYKHILEYPFSLAINLYYGKIDIYIDFKEISKERIKNIQNEKFYLKHFNIEKYDFIIISYETLKEKCISDCIISILVKKVDNKNSKYDIIAYSKPDTPILLNQGKLIRNEIHIDEEQKYIIKDLPKENDGKVMIKFQKGEGKISMTYYCKEYEENGDKIKNEYPFWYANNSHYGQILKIPSIDSIKDEYKNCYYQINIIGIETSFFKEIKYTIIYNYITEEITLNNPIKSHIKQGEIEYFTFSINEEDKHLYVSLFCSDGDADLYMKYGKDLPTLQDYHWYSSNPQFDYISIDKNENYFISNGLNNIGGIYTVMVYGYTESSFSIFVTTHPKKIITLKSNQPSICKSKGKNMIDCYFRFDDLINSYQINDIDIIFNTNFYYGFGDIYVNLVDNSQDDIIDKFPSKFKFDFSNTERNKMNFLKIHIDKNNPKLKLNSILLIGVDCIEECFFEINTAILEKNRKYYYLDQNRKNLFYFEENKEPYTLIFFFTKDTTLTYEISSYTGEAEILIYQNITTFNETSKEFKYEYIHLASTKLTNKNSYLNSIYNNTKNINQNIYFKITPKTNIGFFIQLNYESQWTRVPIGKEIIYQITKNQFNGYFDLFKEYNSVIISIKCNDEDAKGSIYATLNVYQRNIGNTDGKNNPFNFLIPNSENAYYKGKTDPIFNTASIRIKGIKNDEIIGNDRNVRVLFSVYITSNDTEKSISVIISPNVNFYKRIEISPLSIYYSFENITDNEKSIYELKKLKKNDNTFVVELSSCKGNIEASITDKLQYYFKYEEKENKKNIRIVNSNRYILLSFNMTSENYYLHVRGVQNEKDNLKCELNKKKCVTEVNYMVYYYTTNNKHFFQTNRKAYLKSSKNGIGKIKLEMINLNKKDIYGRIYQINDINYKLFISTSPYDYSKMDSLCYLTKMSSLPKNVDHNIKKNEIYISGLKNGEVYFINVLIENPETGELFIFHPIIVEVDSFNLLLIGITIFIIVMLVIGIIYYQNKYFKAEKIIEYERADIMNMARIPQVENITEMANIIKNKEFEKQKEKYSKLTDTDNKI